jgi:hypothetical protein
MKYIHSIWEMAVDTYQSVEQESKVTEVKSATNDGESQDTTNVSRYLRQRPWKDLKDTAKASAGTERTFVLERGKQKKRAYVNTIELRVITTDSRRSRRRERGHGRILGARSKLLHSTAKLHAACCWGR